MFTRGCRTYFQKISHRCLSLSGILPGSHLFLNAAIMRLVQISTFQATGEIVLQSFEETEFGFPRYAIFSQTWGREEEEVQFQDIPSQNLYMRYLDAALEAGGVTAFRLRKEPGSWAGDKGARVATAALGAAAIDAFIDKDPRRQKTSGIKGMAENAVGGLLASKLMGFKSSTTTSGKPRYR
jgi:hypothetical protein